MLIDTAGRYTTQDSDAAADKQSWFSFLDLMKKNRPRQPINGVLVLYGNERCPTNSDGQEIVVCERRSAREQYRVPKELREFQVTPQNESWAARAQGTLDAGVGANSTGSCSTVGAGGQTGCFLQSARAARKENQARKAEEARVP